MGELFELAGARSGELPHVPSLGVQKSHPEILPSHLDLDPVRSRPRSFGCTLNAHFSFPKPSVNGGKSFFGVEFDVARKFC